MSDFEPGARKGVEPAAGNAVAGDSAGAAALDPRRVEILVSFATVAKALLLALFVFLCVVAADVLIAILLALVIAIGLDPLVTGLVKRGLSRGLSALLVLAGLFVALAAIVIWAVSPVWDAIRGLSGDLPAYIADLEDSPGFKQLANNTDVIEKAKELAADAARSIPEAATSLLGLTGGLVGSVLSIVTLIFLTMFLMIGLPDFMKLALGMLRPEQAAQVDTVLDEVTKVISSSLVGNLAISVIAGTVVGVTAVIIGAPFPAALAVIVGVFDLVPQIGSTIAAFIVCLITLAGTGLAAALILAVVIIVYQQVENYLIQPAVYSTAISLSGFATIASVMVGGALLGVAGAILAVPVAGSLKVIIGAIAEPRRERMAALRAAN